MNIFHQQPEFITRDPSFNFKAESGVILNNQENSYIRFSHWIQPADVTGLSVIDIGSRTSAAGGYVLSHGATEYLGIESDPMLVTIATENIKKYYPTANATVLCVSAEEFVQKYNKKFDVAFVGRVLHLVDDGVYFLKNLSKIANTIIIEDVPPLHMPVVYLLGQLKNDTDLTHLFYNLEYCYASSEAYCLDLFNQLNIYPNVQQDPDVTISSTVYSIGFLKETFKLLGFRSDTSSYEDIKKIFPDEYGYGLYKNKLGVKKFIIRFYRNV
jgi:hypothetical protein